MGKGPFYERKLISSLPDEPDGVGVRGLRALLRVRSKAARRRVYRAASHALSAPKLAMDQSVRLRAVKALVAGLPETLSLIQGFLADYSGPHSYEVQFSLFCYLDRTDLPRRKGTRPRVLAMVRDYMLRAKRDTARAAWMAGDLLGDHWGTLEAIDTLLFVSRHAKHQAGKEAALHGLKHGAIWAPRKLRAKISHLLRSVE